MIAIAGINQFRPFAVDPNAALVSQAVWDSLQLRPLGNVPGTIANAALVNKALRQGTLGTATIGEFIIAMNANLDALDTGDPLDLRDAFEKALQEFVEQVLNEMGWGDDWRAMVEGIVREVIPFRLDPDLEELCLLGYDPTIPSWVWVPLSGLDGGTEPPIIIEPVGFWRIRVGANVVDAGTSDNDLFDNVTYLDTDGTTELTLWVDGTDTDFADPIAMIACDGIEL